MFGKRDPRVREFVPATRIVWARGIDAPERLLADDETTAALPPGASVVLDFGRELHGGVRLEVPRTDPKGSPQVRVRFGESVREAMDVPDQDHAIHDQTLHLAWMGHTDVGNTGFRFVRLDNVDPAHTVHLRYAPAVFLYRDLPYRGSFVCSDERLNRIWQVGAYTVHLCLQDQVWDGIKRDRLVWIGDLHPEAMVAATVFGDLAIVRESLDFVRDRTPLPGWMNGISSYSLWWVLIHRDWWWRFGNCDYLYAQRSYLLPLLEQIAARVAPDGGERLDGHRFLEWPTSEDRTAIDAGLQALVVLALRAGAELCRAIGEDATAERAQAAADRAAVVVRKSPSKQATALRVLAGMADPRAANAAILGVDPYRGLSTFYGYYVLQARALASDIAGCLDLIRTYWGGMLAMGATTFWEGFEIDWMDNATRIDEMPAPGRPDIHADFGAWCYRGLRHSLCHGWAAGPTAWLTQEILGVAPAAPGFSVVRIRPNLAGLDWARGTLPTPQGPIEVSHERRPDGSVASTWTVPGPMEVRP